MRAAAGCPALKTAVVPERRLQRDSRLLRTVIMLQFRGADQQLATPSSSLKSICSSRARRALEAGNKELNAGNL